MDSLQGLVWVATTPEGLRCIGQSTQPRVLSDMVGQVAVALAVVERKRLLKMRMRGGELSDKAQGSPQHGMNHAGHGGILLSFCEGEELFPQGERRCEISSHAVIRIQSKQDLCDLERLTHLQTQLLLAGVDLFHFGGAIPLRDHQRRAKTQLESQFLLGASRRVWERHQQR